MCNGSIVEYKELEKSTMRHYRAKLINFVEAQNAKLKEIEAAKSSHQQSRARNR